MYVILNSTDFLLLSNFDRSLIANSKIQTFIFMLPNLSSSSSYLKHIVYAGFVLSETQILVNLKSYTDIYYFPSFTVSYFLISTAYLLYAFCSYAFLARRGQTLGLEVFEYICLPISVFLITLLTRNDDVAGYQTLGVLLLGVQSLLIVLKVVYFGPLFPDLAHISILYKLARILKLNLIAILPLFLSQQMIMAGVLAVCQVISTSIFFFKFTYQRLDYQYLLLVGVFSGMVSASQSVFETIFGLNYLFFGQLTSVYYYAQPDSYLRSIIEIKHITNCQNKSSSKSDDDNLAAFLFINQCLFPNKQTLPLTNNAKSQAIIQAVNLLDKLPGAADDKNFSQDKIIKAQLQKNCRPLLISLLELYHNCFHEACCFAAFQFLVNSCLYLGGSYINLALIIYYHQLERISQKKSMFQTCKYEYLYMRIRAFIQSKETDQDEVECIEFSDSLRELNLQIQECFINQLKMIEYLLDNQGKESTQAVSYLFKRNKSKVSIRARFEQCFSKEIYFISNEFKFLFILYETTIERRGQRLHEMLRTHFLTSEVQKLKQTNKLRSMVVLSGFKHGEILNSNEIFKSHFGITLTSFARNNIAEFIPTQIQKNRHTQLMSQFVEFKLKNRIAHDQLQCWLLLEREFNAIKLKIVQKFQIGVRIFYEHHGGFHYICSLTLFVKQQGRSSLTLLKRDCEVISSKGVMFELLGAKKVTQLGEVLDLCEISFNQTLQNLQLTNKAQTWQKKQYAKQETDKVDILQDKLGIIQQKMIDGDFEGKKAYSGLNWLQIIIFLATLVFLVFMFVSVHQDVNSLGIVVTDKQSPVIQAQLLRNRIIMQQQILSFIIQTPYFPSNLCSSFGIPNLTDYVMTILKSDIINNTNEFLSLITMPNYGNLDDHLYVRQFTSPYLKNYPINISFQKSISLLKMQIFSWLSTVRNTTLNTNFYTQTFPTVLMSGSLGSPNVLSTLMDADQAIFTNYLNSKILNYEVTVAMVLGSVCIIMAILRIWDNYNLVGYLRVVERVKGNILQARMLELKSALSQLHNLMTNCIQGIDFSPDMIIEIRQDQGTQNIPIADFADWHLENRDTYNQNETQEVMEQYNHLLNRHQTDDLKEEKSSQLWRTFKYLFIYLVLFVGAVTALMFLAVNILQKQNDEVNLISLCDNATSSIMTLQQTMIELVSYNWLKVLSLKQAINMTLPNSMFNSSTWALFFNPYQQRFNAAYSRQFSNSILNGDVCIFFNDPDACENYRNGLFKTGFSMMVPYVLKQELQTNQISNNASYYIPNLCDKTWLLFEGIIPMTTQIPEVGYSTMINAVDSQYLSSYLQLSAAWLAVLILTLVYQYRRFSRQRIIRDETLSLDTVSSLYSIPEFKPYFNRIYYS